MSYITPTPRIGSTSSPRRPAISCGRRTGARDLTGRAERATGGEKCSCEDRFTICWASRTQCAARCKLDLVLAPVWNANNLPFENRLWLDAKSPSSLCLRSVVIDDVFPCHGAIVRNAARDVNNRELRAYGMLDTIGGRMEA